MARQDAAPVARAAVGLVRAAGVGRRLGPIGGRDQAGDPGPATSGAVDDAAPRAVGAAGADQARRDPPAVLAEAGAAAGLVHRTRLHGRVPAGTVGRERPPRLPARPGVRLALVPPALLRKSRRAAMRARVGEVAVLPRGPRVPPGVGPAPLARVPPKGVAPAVEVPRRPVGGPEAELPLMPAEATVVNEPEAGREPRPGLAVPRPPGRPAAVDGAADQRHHAARLLGAPLPTNQVRRSRITGTGAGGAAAVDGRRARPASPRRLPHPATIAEAPTGQPRPKRPERASGTVATTDAPPAAIAGHTGRGAAQPSGQPLQVRAPATQEAAPVARAPSGKGAERTAAAGPVGRAAPVGTQAATPHPRTTPVGSAEAQGG